MAATIIDGKKVASDIQEELKKDITELKKRGVEPGLAVVLIGENPASKKYVGSKEKTCSNLGIASFPHKLPETTSQEELMSLIDSLNKDPQIHGILVQLPLPKGLDEKAVMNAISPDKDVDGFGPASLGRLVMGTPLFIPCTPYRAIKMLDAYKINAEGKHAVVIGRSIIVGKPLALLLQMKNATVTMCHSKTPNLKDECLKADILCVAIGRAKMVTGDMVKEGAAVIDVGINVTDEGKIVGDVDFDAAKERAGYITPVPGGAGPMTIAMLMYNTVQSAKRVAGMPVSAL